MEQALYHPQEDAQFSTPYIDRKEERTAPITHVYMHGGFTGTNVRFSLYFPPKEQYEKRFFHLVTPVQGNEDASQALPEAESPICFAVSHGAYFVESNMGGNNPDAAMLYRSSAAVAEYSRIVAGELFGEHRPCGYIFGGSGGAFKAIACVQNTKGIWDGSVPLVIGSPMAIPNMFTVRVHAMRLLRNKMERIIDAAAPGGGDLYEGLNEEERAALEEVTKMGFPPKAWFSYEEIGAGALPVLCYAIDQMDPGYYEDFWTLPGYLGADPNGSAVRDRLQFETTVKSVLLPEGGSHSGKLGIDDAWQTLAMQYESDPAVLLEDAPRHDYLDGTKVIITSGQAAGLKLPLGRLDGQKAVIGEAFGMGDIADLLKAVKPGDSVRLDNSDYIALQTYHRHQYPGKDYAGWEQFADKDGNPIYPQRAVLTGPLVAQNGAGSIQNGYFNGKMIVVCSLLDESALPWNADWYRRRVKEVWGDAADDRFRLWYNEHAMHGGEYDPNRSLQIVSYHGAMNQALLDVSRWAEKGIAPPAGTGYTVVDAQVQIPDCANERLGVQPTATLLAHGQESLVVKAGETVQFTGTMETPPDAGMPSLAELDFEGTGAYGCRPGLETAEDNQRFAQIHASHTFETPGVYFPVLRVSSSRDGSTKDPYVQIKNLARVRVTVK